MMKKQLFLLLIAALMTCFTSTAWAWSGSGTSSDPYLITNATDWNTLAANSSSDNYSGKYFKLTGDITVSEMVGTGSLYFAGNFDGAGHTLTFNKGTAGSRFSEQHCAPFRFIYGATIKCLHIAGTIYTSNQFAGVVGRTGDTNHIIACRSSLTIDCSKSGDGTNGGFIGVVEGTRTYFTNCLFDGQLLGSSSDSNGGFCGWSQNGVTFTNCMFAPSSVTFSASSSKTFSRGNNVSDSNCYYKQQYGDAQGANAGSMSNKALQEALGIGWEISGGKVVPIISLRALTGEGTQASPYLIGSATDWDNLAVNVALGETYSGKFFKLTNNITVSEMVGTDQNNHFAGTFDGDGYTLTFNKGTADSRFAENFCAPFRYTRGASLKNLIIAGTIYTSAQFAAVLGNAHGDTYIDRCRSSIVINSSISGDGTHGGFIGVTDDGHNHFTNCVFNGKMVGSNTNSCGGFVGWTDAIYGSSTSEFTNCLFAPAELTVGSSGSAAFSRGRDNNTANITLTNCYYTTSFGTAQGTDGSSNTNAQLASALGSVWIVQDSKVVPVLYYHFAGEGTEGNPYLIATATDWQGIATNINFYSENYDAKYFLQTADFSTTEMVGEFSSVTSYKAFRGTYDGGGHTLDVNLYSEYRKIAPFRVVNSATIKNLRTTGTITGHYVNNSTEAHNGMNMAGIAGHVVGTTTIRNCISSATLTSDRARDVDAGGIVAHVHDNQHVIVEGCAFVGTINYTNATGYEGGGIVGWTRTGSTATITNCVFAPAAMNITKTDAFYMIGSCPAMTTLTNCYYSDVAAAVKNSGLTAMGDQQMHTITPATGVTVTHLDVATSTYNVSGLTFYGNNGVEYDGVFYAGVGDEVSLNISGSTGYKPSAGTLTGAGPYTLTMADANTVIYPAATCTAPTAINPTYTGVAQALVNAGTATGGTMMYSLDNDTWDVAVPTAKNAGDYTVYYKVIGDETHADYTPSPNIVAASIAKAPLTIKADDKWLDYGDPLEFLVATYTGFVNGEGPGYVQPAVKFSSDYTQGDNAGTYTITPYGAGAANYEISYQTGVLHVNKVASTITTTPTAIDGLVANGSAQTLINAGEATGGEMQYSLNNTSWSTDLPTATDANTYTVYYKVVGDVNHNSIPAASLSVTIAPAPASMVITANVDPNHAGVYYSTFFDSQNSYLLPAGVEAYIATISGNDLLMNKIAVAGQTIPANNAVILKSTVNPFTLTVSDATPVTFSDANSLQGTDVAIATPANCYVLSGKSGVGFYQYTGANLNPHKAYVIFSGSFAPQRMRFIFEEEQNTTAVDNAEAENTQTIKVIENGALYIIKDGVRYNAQGQIVEL